MLSRERYVSAAPGPVKNDTTIVPKPVMGDQVHLDGGTAHLDDGILDVLLSGRDGFSLTARLATYDSGLSGVFQCGQDEVCPPGSRMWIGVYSVGELGPITYRGTTYPPDQDEIRVLQFRGFVTMPAAGPAIASVSAPFSITGTVSYTPDGASTQVVNYIGGGHATFHLRSAPGGGSWFTERAEFTISRP